MAITIADSIDIEYIRSRRYILTPKLRHFLQKMIFEGREPYVDYKVEISEILKREYYNDTEKRGLNILRKIYIKKYLQ